MEYAVSRDGRTLVTLHEGTDTTARDQATEELADSLASLASSGAVTRWTVDDAEVHEHPVAPFDPYTIAVGFGITVVVDAPDRVRAEEIGADAIDSVLADAGVDSISYTSSPAASAA